MEKKETIYFDRLLTEFSELKDKIDKLEDFIENNPKFLQLSTRMRGLMKEQLRVMVKYFNILVLRIELISPNNKVIEGFIPERTFLTSRIE
jgi:hypothetical protein